MFRRTKFLRANLGLVLLPMFLASCMAIAPDAGNKEVFFILHDEDSAGLNGYELKWSEDSTLYTNRSSFVVSGTCEARVYKAKVLVTGPSVSRQISVPCERGAFSINFSGENELPHNGDYALSFWPLDAEEQPYNAGVEKILKYRLRDLSGEMAFTQPTSSGQTVSTPTYDFAGTCSSNYDLSYSLTAGSSNAVGSCNTGSVWNQDSFAIALGSNNVVLGWSDEYGNSASTQIILNRVLPGAAIVLGGMTSGTPVGTVLDGNPSAGKLFYSSSLPLSAAPNTGQVNPLTIESSPSGAGWAMPGNFGRVVNSP